MISVEDYRRHDGLGLAELVRSGEVSAAELLEVAIGQAERLNPHLNAIIIPMYELARARAAGPLDGPFAGVPFLVKDLFQEYEGVTTAYGCKALKRAAVPAAGHAEITRRWLRAGTVIFGRTNSPEFGAKGITEPEAWGATRNPWNLGHTPGGSSGGSAAMVAAGVVPMAGANDGGGSIRIPAACCGLFGLKPGRGRTPWGPRYGEMMHGAAMNHVISRSVRDSAAMLDATHGHEPGAFYRLEPPARPYLEEVGREPGKLRIAYTTQSPIGTPVHPEAVAAVENNARLLESLGHYVEPAEPPIDGLQVAEDWLMMWFAHTAATVREVRRQTGCGLDGFEADTLAMAAFGEASRASEYIVAFQRWNDYMRQLDGFFEHYDLLMTPTLAHPPARIGEVATPAWQHVLLKIVMSLRLSRVALATGVVERMAKENLKWVPFTQLENVTGVPAMSVPLHWTADGLPMGVHFAAPHGEEGRLLRLAAQLEQARPWAQRRPEL